MQLNGARILIECLIREGVNIIFGYPGGSVLDIYDELPQYGEQLRHVLVRHEQAAVHAADGYARATGKVGVCMATSGPGATNTVTGIATAYCDSIPMVIFTGQVPTGLIGNDAFQEVDIAGITRPCTKHNYVVKDVKDLAKVVRQAFYLARSGRPGPVLVDPWTRLQRKAKSSASVPGIRLNANTRGNLLKCVSPKNIEEKAGSPPHGAPKEHKAIPLHGKSPPYEPRPENRREKRRKARQKG